jgi:hypothetical protein
MPAARHLISPGPATRITSFVVIARLSGGPLISFQAAFRRRA